MISLKVVKSLFGMAPALILGVLFLQGCLTDTHTDTDRLAGPFPSSEGAHVVMQLNFENKTQTPLEGLRLRFTSNLRDTLYDTLSIAALEPDSARSIEKTFQFLPLRWWSLEVQAIDSSGLVQATGNAGPIGSRGGVRLDTLAINLIAQGIAITCHLD